MKKLNSSYRCGEMRATKDNVIYGQIPYNSPSEDLGYIEILKPGCFGRAIAKSDNIMSLWNHDSGKPLGSTRAGTLKIKDTFSGLNVSITPDLKTTWGISALSAVKRGDIAGLSFGFIVRSNGIQWKANNVREIHEVDELLEISPVAFPAYKGSCVRSRRYTCDAGRSRHIQNVVREMRNFFGIRDMANRTQYSIQSLREFFGMPDLSRHMRYKKESLRHFFNKGRTKEDFKDFFNRGGRSRQTKADLKSFFQ